MIKFLIAKYYNFVNQLFYKNVEESYIENPNKYIIEINDYKALNKQHNQNDCIKWLYADTII